MPTKITALILSFLSFFMVWNINSQPNCIPETRTYQGEVPDKYGLWPTEDFTRGKALPWPAIGLLQGVFAAKGLLIGGAKTDSLLVLHKGELIYENYAGGWDADTPHFMASVTKSFLSALVGIAIAEGKIKGVDDRVIDFFPDANIALGQESKRDMTVEQLLTMTSGLPGDGDPWDDIWPSWWDAKDSGLAAFETPQMAAPGERYAYSSGPGCQTLACLVERAVNQNLFEYAKAKLFQPLGMKSVSWDAADDGRNFGGFGISMTPRDMLRFGYLYLNYGRWEDTQLLPAEWVVQSGPKSKSPKAYGRMFWNFNLLPFDRSFEANGAFGQYICILPEWDTVIVRTASPSKLDDFIGDIGRALGLS